MSNEYHMGQAGDFQRELNNRNVESSAAFVKHLLSTTTSLLDCGCGPGSITSGFHRICSEGRVIGIDIDPEAIENAQRKYSHVNFQQGDATHIPFADNTFDIVYSNHVLSYLSDAKKAITEMKRVCKPGGTVAIRVTDHPAVVWFPEFEGVMRAKSLYDQVITLGGGDCAVARKMPLMAMNIGFCEVKIGGSMDIRANKEERELASCAWKGVFTDDSMKGACEKYGILKDGDIELINKGMDEFCSTDGAIFLLPQVEILCEK